jgi:hypothetical protein
VRDERKRRNKRVEKERVEKGRGAITANVKGERKKKDERVERETIERGCDVIVVVMKDEKIGVTK